jgi:sec-independent protein translocase protein TatC
MSAQERRERSAGSRGARLLRGRKAPNPEGRMPLMEHIRELRSRVLKALLAMTLGAIAGWYLYRYIWPFLEKPYCRLNLPDEFRSTATTGKACGLVVTGLFDSLFLHLKIAIATGVIISAPIWLFQLWAFIAPGLHSRERRWAYFFGGSAVPLFAIGGAVAYFAMTKGLRFLIGLVPKGVIPIITINTYLGYAMAMLLIFALAFELPLVMVLFNVAGILTHQRFAKWRRMIIFCVFAFAAVATPSPDPISMLLLAVPCVVLVECAEVFAWANDRRRARRGPQFPGLSPEEVTAYGLNEPMPDEFDDIDTSR